MRDNICHAARPLELRTAGAVVALVLIAIAPGAAYAEEAKAGISFDGLERVKHSKVSDAYIDPNADFSVFKRVKILDPYVAFRSNWKRDQKRDRTRNVTTSDMERIKSDVASLFREVFAETLEADGGFEVVDVSAEDVLLLRPAIIDLDVTAPDTMEPGRGRTFTTSAGAATLYIELFDSVSGDIIGRAFDRRRARSSGTSSSWSNRASNSAAARRMFQRWADLLRNFLDQHYTK